MWELACLRCEHLGLADVPQRYHRSLAKARQLPQL